MGQSKYIETNHRLLRFIRWRNEKFEISHISASITIVLHLHANMVTSYTYQTEEGDVVVVEYLHDEGTRVQYVAKMGRPFCSSVTSSITLIGSEDEERSKRHQLVNDTIQKHLDELAKFALMFTKMRVINTRYGRVIVCEYRSEVGQVSYRGSIVAKDANRTIYRWTVPTVIEADDDDSDRVNALVADIIRLYEKWYVAVKRNARFASYNEVQEFTCEKGFGRKLTVELRG